MNFCKVSLSDFFFWKVLLGEKKINIPSSFERNENFLSFWKFILKVKYWLKYSDSLLSTWMMNRLYLGVFCRSSLLGWMETCATVTLPSLKTWALWIRVLLDDCLETFIILTSLSVSAPEELETFSRLRYVSSGYVNSHNLVARKHQFYATVLLHYKTEDPCDHSIQHPFTDTKLAKLNSLELFP